MGVFWWIPALIPLIGALILLACPAWPISRWEGAKSEGEITESWKKFGVYLVVNFLACLLFAWGSWFGAISKTYFNEVWNFQVTGIRHEMRWTTHETRTETHTTGSGKNRKTHTKTIHYTKSHGPYWYQIDEYGDEKKIDEGEYNHWKSIWANERQTGMHKGSSAGFDRKIDGPILSCSWPGTFETVYPETMVKKYVNKIRVSNSVLRYGDPTPQQVVLFPRPVDEGNISPVVNRGGISISSDDMLYLQRVSATLGRRYEIHPLLVTFGKDTGRDMVSGILKAWQGPNKNELVTFICLNGQEVKWVEVHSWMDNTTIHAMIRDSLMSKPFTVRGYGELLQANVPKLWSRKHFTPINAYLRVSIDPRWIILAVILSVIMGIVSYFLIERGFGGSRETWGDDSDFWKYRAGLSTRFRGFRT